MLLVYFIVFLRQRHHPQSTVDKPCYQFLIKTKIRRRRRKGSAFGDSTKVRSEKTALCVVQKPPLSKSFPFISYNPNFLVQSNYMHYIVHIYYIYILINTMYFCDTPNLFIIRSFLNIFVIVRFIIFKVCIHTIRSIYCICQSQKLYFTLTKYARHAKI